MLTTYKITKLVNLTTRDIIILGNDEKNWDINNNTPLIVVPKEDYQAKLHIDIKLNYGLVVQDPNSIYPSSGVIPVGSILPVKVLNLPPEEKNIRYIVPRVVAEAVKGIRNDIYIVMGKLGENATTLWVRSLVRL